MKQFIVCIQLIFLCTNSMACNAQIDFKQIEISNKINNNKYNINYFSQRNDVNSKDSLYFYLDNNYKYYDKLLIEDYCNMAFYYLQINDTLKAFRLLTSAIQKGLDTSHSIYKQCSESKNFNGFVKQNLEKNYFHDTEYYKKSIDSSLISNYKVMFGLEQLLRSNISEYYETIMKEDLITILNIVDSLNLSRLKSFIFQNKGLGSPLLGDYRPFISLVMHTTDKNIEDYNFMMKYIIQQVQEFHISIFHFLMIVNRHTRDLNKPNLCDNFNFNFKTSDKNCDCNSIEIVWEKLGLGSFKLYLRSKSIKYNKCNE